MTDGYYDHHALIALSAPLTLVGHPGAGVAAIGRMISGRTGLPFNDVARSAEAVAGRSGAQIVVEEGMARLRQLEAGALRQAVERRPFGVVVVESGLLEDRPLHQWLRRSSRVVYVRRPAARLLERIRAQLRERPGSLPEFVFGAPATADELAAHLARRSDALDETDVVFDAGDLHPARVAGALLEELVGDAKPRS